MIGTTWSFSLRSLKPREGEDWVEGCYSSQGRLLRIECGSGKATKKGRSRGVGGLEKSLAGPGEESGEVSGVTFTTSHPLCLFQVHDIKVPNQEFGLSENEPGTNFLYATFDGIMGMAYPALSTDGATTALQGMLQEGALTCPVFSFYLSSQQSSQDGGAIVFGGVDNSLYTGQIHWTPVTQELYWQIGIEEPPISSPFRFLIGDQTSGWCSQGCQAIVDTGTSLLTVPQQFMSALLQATGAQEDQYRQFLVDCNNTQSLPTFTFIISGVQFPLPPSSYILNNDEGCCTVGVEVTYLPSQNGQPLWILGDVFLRSYYSVYDMSNNRVGFATAA
ncbi:Gastricsin [Camelus dromedarius]|uniref:Gastricsin n=1 Tax=Camelus dromedarius TaxID=9838 RepID=A0A5N4CS98_CAMDR|nr:Gastricsin [Camelus dromedarius]